MLGDMLKVLPTRPVVYIAPAIVLVVMSLYYWNLYSDCTDDRQRRMELSRMLATGDWSGPFRLAEFTDFAWDQVRIVTNFRPERRNIDCPLGWNWPEGKREYLISSDQLTALIFAQQGSVVEYLELQGDEIVFTGTGSALTPENAVFEVMKTGPGDFLLKHIR